MNAHQHAQKIYNWTKLALQIDPGRLRFPRYLLYASFLLLGLAVPLAPSVGQAAETAETIPSITHGDGGSYNYGTATAGEDLVIEASGDNSIDLRYRSSATISTTSAGGVGGNITLNGGILLGPNLSTSNPGFLTINSAGTFNSAGGLQSNTDSTASITASSISFAAGVNASRNSSLTFNGNTSITSGTNGLYSGLGSGITVNGDLTINSVEYGLSVGGGDGGFITVNGASYIHANSGMGVSVFQDNTATFNGYAHIVSDGNYGVYIQGSANQPEALAKFTDVLVESQNNGIHIQSNGGAIEVSGTAEVHSGNVGVSSTSGRAEFNNLKVVSQHVGIYSNNRNSTTQESTVTVSGTVDITASTSSGVLAYQGGTVTLNNGIVRGTGDNVYGLRALENGQITLNGQLTASTDGDNAHGIHAANGGEIFSNGATSVVTGGDRAVGIYVAADGSVTARGLLGIQTSGTAAHGLYLEAGGAFASSSGLQINTSGAAAYGLYLDQGNSLDVAGSVAIQTGGAQSHGVYADNASGISLHGGSIAVADGSYALYSDNGSSLNLAAGSGSAGSYAISGDVFADNGSQIDVNFASGSSLLGATSMGDTASSINFTMSNTLWQLSDVSTLTSLAANGSTINLTGKTFSNGDFSGDSWLPFGNTLTVENLGGSGSSFLMRTDIVNEQATTMSITESSSGAHRLYVFNDGGAQTTGEEIVNLVYDAGATRSASFALSHAVELGGWTYKLEKSTDPGTGESVWYLKGSDTPAPSSTGSGITNIFRASRYLSIAETQTLIQRLGELRGGANSNEVWVRGYGGRINVKEGDYARDFSMTYGGGQVGGDRKFEIAPQASRWGDLYLGAMFSYTYGDLDFRESGNGSVDSKTLGAYATVVSDNGFYTDFILKGMWLNNDLSGRDSAGEGVSGEVDRFGAGASLEVGKRFDVARPASGTVYVEPKAQLSYNWYEGGTLKASNGLNMKLDDYQEGIARVGLQAGYQWETKSGSNYNAYAIVSHSNAFGDDLSIKINDASRVKEDISDHWWSAGVGVTANVAENQNLYLEYDYADGHNFRQPWAVKAGWRLSF